MDMKERHGIFNEPTFRCWVPSRLWYSQSQAAHSTTQPLSWVDNKQPEWISENRASRHSCFLPVVTGTSKHHRPTVVGSNSSELFNQFGDYVVKEIIKTLLLYVAEVRCFNIGGRHRYQFSTWWWVRMDYYLEPRKDALPVELLVKRNMGFEFSRLKNDYFSLSR